jgi:peroxiredoxin
MMMRTAQWGVIIGLLALTAGMGVRMYKQWQLEKQPQMLSEFSFLDGASTLHSSNEWKGKVLVINFWATSCVTCVKEMPDLVNTYEKYKSQGLEFIALAMSYDPPMYVVNFAETRKLPFIVAMDSDGSAAKAFGKIQLTPTTLVINKQGKIIKRYVGEPEWNDFHKLLEKSLADKS